MMNSQADTIRMAGVKLGYGPKDLSWMVSNPSEITARLRYQQTFPRS